MPTWFDAQPVLETALLCISVTGAVALGIWIDRRWDAGVLESDHPCDIDAPLPTEEPRP